MDLGDSIRERGWRQGCLLDSASASSLFDDADTDAEVEYADFVLVSHSCDVVSAERANEPYVEFIGRRRVDSSDGNFAFAKSPRVWHMSDSTGHYELRITSRRRMARQHLAELEPSGSLSDDQIRTLRRWMANRYARAAFADEFNRRVRSTQAAIWAQLKRTGGLLSGIYLMVDDAELPENMDYEIVVIGTMLDDDFQIPEHRATSVGAINFVAEQLDSCTGVAVIDSELRPESAVSLTDLRELSRWDYDSLSLRDESAALPAIDQGS